MMVMKLKVQVVKEEDGRFSVFVPGLPGCMAQGNTEEEALQSMKDLIPEYLECMTESAAKALPHVREIQVVA
jgi:predicted RNase H-like HicB family nuclease